MTDPMELVGRLEGHEARYRRSATIASNRVGRDPSQRSHVTLNNRRADDMAEAAACIREMVGWRPIETAPRDGTEIIAMMTGADGRWEHLNGRAFVIRNRSLSADDYDLGWDVYPGFGGVSDRWFSGWLPLPPAPGAEDE